MSPIKASDRRTPAEWAFLALFFPAVVAFYAIYKYPHWLLPAGADLRAFHLFGKSPGFWYATAYTALVSGVCLWVLIGKQNRYQRSKKKDPLSRYQRGKFASILLAQSIAFYLIPFALPGWRQKERLKGSPCLPTCLHRGGWRRRTVTRSRPAERPICIG